MQDVIARKIEPQIESALEQYPAVTIYGPRQAGKTTLLQHIHPEFSYANLEHPMTRLLAASDPDEFFTRFPDPVIIDEIQRVPELLSTIQVRSDKRQKTGQYLITGGRQLSLRSSVVQSLAGRTAILHLLPLSLEELETVSLEFPRDIQMFSCFLPYLYTGKSINVFDYYENYVSTYIDKDISSMNAVHNLLHFEKFLHLLAGRTGQIVNYSSLANEVGVSSTTLAQWTSILEASHIVFTLRPWFSSYSKQMIKSPKVYFCDTGLLVHLLGIQDPNQLTFSPFLGQVFENLVVLEVLKARLNRNLPPELFFFRT